MAQTLLSTTLGFLWLAAPLWWVPLAKAEVTPGPLFTDAAVLQQGKPVAIWGSASPGESVAVHYDATQGGATASAQTTADHQGQWAVKLPPLPASATPGTLTFQGSGNTVVRKNIVVGEVWLASGQSNMDTALFWTERGKALAKSANFPNIRYYKVGTVASDHPEQKLKARWSVCLPQSAGGFTELGFHFARELHEKLGVPVGIINSSWGGTGIESWMDAQSLDGDPAGAAVRARWSEALAEYPAKQAKYEAAMEAWTQAKSAAEQAGGPFKQARPYPPSHKPGSQYTPSGTYNAMIHPLVPYSLQGIIWYQGENNARRPGEYRTLFPSLINGWRKQFAQGEIPFYWVQLPSYNIGADQADWAGLRAAQTSALTLPNTGQAVTIDIGDPKEIHPDNKAQVAERLARIALKRTYQQANIVDEGPRVKQAEFLPDGAVRITLAAADGVPETELPGFEAAGPDGVFHPAHALVEGASGTLIVRCDNAPAPEVVRYAWRNNPGPLELANAEGLPAAPFMVRRGEPVNSSTTPPPEAARK